MICCGFFLSSLQIIMETAMWKHVNNYRSIPHSWPVIGCVTRLARRVPLVEQEILTLPKHMSSPPLFSGVRVNPSLVLCVYFEDLCLSLCPFSLCHCVAWSYSIYGLWLLLWHLQTLLSFTHHRCPIYFWKKNINSNNYTPRNKPH